MKVTFVMRPDGGLGFGGAEVQAIETATALRGLGVDVEIMTPLTREVGDIVHAFGPYQSYTPILDYCKKREIPFVLSTIFFRNYKNNLFLYRDKLRAKRKYHPLRYARWLMRNSSFLLPNTVEEADLVTKLFTQDRVPMRVVPNGAESRFANANPELFRKKFSIDYDFVLNVARLEDRKNQLNLIKAINKSDKKLVIIGRNINDSYARQCMAEAGPNIRFIDAIPHEDPLLASAYAACKVFALPSTLETPGIAAIEAGLAGAQILTTPNGGGREYFLDYAEYPNVFDVDSISIAIDKLWSRSANNSLKEHLVQNYTWENIALKTLNVYKQILGV